MQWKVIISFSKGFCRLFGFYIIFHDIIQEKCRDPLAEAMAHVHSEYLEEEVEYQENVQMEMVVESTNDAMSVLSEPVDDEKTSKCENEKTVIKATKNGTVLVSDNF